MLPHIQETVIAVSQRIASNWQRAELLHDAGAVAEAAAVYEAVLLLVVVA